MKKAERLRVERFVTAALPILEMRDWRVSVQGQPAPVGSVACSLRIDGQKVGAIRLGKNFWNQEPHDIKQTLLHELLHLVSADVRDFVYKSVPGVTKTPAWSAFHPLFDHALEVMVDTLAYSFASLIDLEV